MTQLMILPDGTRVTASQMTVWAVTAATIQIGLSGAFSSGSISYVAQNNDVANAILALVDTWYFNPLNPFLNVTMALGVAIFSLSPTSSAHASTTGVTITGQQFKSGATVTMAGITYATVFTDSTTIAFTYLGASAIGIYDVIVTNPDKTSFTLTQSFTLS